MTWKEGSYGEDRLYLICSIDPNLPNDARLGPIDWTLVELGPDYSKNVHFSVLAKKIFFISVLSVTPCPPNLLCKHILGTPLLISGIYSGIGPRITELGRKKKFFIRQFAQNSQKCNPFWPKVPKKSCSELQCSPGSKNAKFSFARGPRSQSLIFAALGRLQNLIWYRAPY